MAVITDRVNPGDVISSALMRKIIDLVNAHETALGGGGPGGNVVPNLFGQTLTSAQVALQLQNLVLGTVVNTGGAIVSPAAPSSAQLIVLNQVPVAGSTLGAGRSVDIVVAGSSGGPPPPPPPPVILQIVPTSVRANDTLEIQGTNLSGTQATVTFGGIAGSVLGTSNQTRLFVTVPIGIPGAPTAPGNPPANNMPVRVTNPANQVVTTSVTILAPLASPLTIASFAPTIGVVGQPLNVVGIGFSATASQNRVSFGGIVATPTAATATQLTVTVPAGIPGLVAPGDLTTVNVTATRTTDNVTSGARPLLVTL